MRTFHLSIIFCFIFFWLTSVVAAGELSDPYLIYSRHYDAVGGVEQLKGIKTVYSEGDAEHDGLKGSFKMWQHKPLQYRLEEDYGVITQTTGDDGSFAWEQGPNGQVQIIRDPETIKRRILSEQFEQFDHLNKQSKYFRLTYEGIQKVNGIDCYVVRMTNTLNSDIVLSFFNRTTKYLVQEITIQPDYEMHTAYSDNRWVEGILFSFLAESKILPRGKRELNRTNKLILNPDIQQNRYKIPARSKRDFQFVTGDRAENIPFAFIENNIYLKVQIQGDPKYWAVDSGASMSVIDAGYAEKLGLAVGGQITGFGFGETFDLSVVELPGLKVGNLLFNKQKVFQVSGFADNMFGIEVVGILGYDFLSRIITKIDYAHKTFSFYDPKTFFYSGKGTIIDAPLLYRTFTLPVTIDGTITGRWSIDLGAYESTFHYQSATQYSLHNRHGVEKVSRGMASEFIEKTIQFNTLQLGGLTITHPRINIPIGKGKGANSIGELDGNLGNSTLKNFVLYLDYDKQQVIVEKGGMFNIPSPVDKSGITLGQPDDSSVLVAYVAANSPGEEAGFLAGDYIKEINGKQVGAGGELSILAIRSLFKKKPGTKYSLTILRKGEKLVLHLTLKNLFN